jgi:hypothetical protein
MLAYQYRPGTLVSNLGEPCRTSLPSVQCQKMVAFDAGYADRVARAGQTCQASCRITSIVHTFGRRL